jgi:uncharacterized protein YgbK (DUF1537 family)
MLLGCIADDFTGASDLAGTLAREGMRTRLFTGPPQKGAADDVDAGVVMLKSRSIPAADAVAQSIDALERLQALGCRQFLFKYCSTFDSTPEGNIGPVAEALAEALDAKGVIVCPAFPATGRTVYQGHLFVNGKLLSESGMEHHPLTPMTDPDLRRWLARQSRNAPGHVPQAIVARGADAIRAALAAQADTGTILVVVDAIDEAGLRTIGHAAADARLITGGSGIAIGLPDNFRRSGALAGHAAPRPASDGPALVLAGSCSIATREQVALYAQNHPAFRIPVDRLLAGEPVAEEAAAFAARYRDAAPILYSTDAPDAVASIKSAPGGDNAAGAIERLFGELAVKAVADGVQRLVVAGGETSGVVVTALALTALDIGAEIDPGVPALASVTPAGAPLALALKSGNFGAPDFLGRAVAVLGGKDG